MAKFARPNAYNGRKSNQAWTGEARFANQTETNAGDRGDLIVSPLTLDAAVDVLVADASTTVKGKIRIATDAEAIAGVSTVTAMTPHTVGLIAIAGAPLASEILAGIAELATQVETDAGVDDNRIVTPLKLKTNLTTPPAIGGTTPNTGAFTTLTATSAAGITLDATTASKLGTSAAGQDLTLYSTLGRVIVNAEEAAANAITLVSAAGGLDVDAALAINIDSSEVAATALTLSASGGGIDITAAANDIDIAATLASVNITANEAAADAVVITSSAGGIDITAVGGAGQDIDISNTGSVNISSSENAADAITIASSAGGMTLTATGSAGEDISITSAGSSINLLATENAAQSIYIRANGGVTETVDIRASQGTGAASVSLLSTAGGVTINGGLGTADAINITCGAAGGGIDVDAGTAGFIVDTTGGISLDAAAASNFTATGAFDITVSSTAGSINISGGEAAADAINIDAAAGGLDVDVALQMNLTSSQAAIDAVRVFASDAAGGVDVDAGTGGIAVDSTGAISIDAAGVSNFTTTGAFDLTVASTLGSVVISAGEDAADAITITASGVDSGINISAGSGNVNIAGKLALTSAATQLIVEGGAVTDFIGTATLIAGTITVLNTNIAATDRIFIQRDNLLGSPALGHLIYTIHAGADFVVNSYTAAGGPAATDVSSFVYFIVRQS